MDSMSPKDVQEQTPSPSLNIPTVSAAKGKKCPYCPSEFRKADHYQRHVRSHTKEKPFRCPICRKAYPRHDTLLRHARIHKQNSDGEGLDGKLPSRLHSEPGDEETYLPKNVSTTPGSTSLEASIIQNQGTAATHSRSLSLDQGDERFILPGASQSSSSPISFRNLTPGFQILQPDLYPVATSNPFQAATMLPSPPVAESDPLLKESNDCFSIHDPLAGSILTELPGFGTENWLLNDFDFSVLEQRGFASTPSQMQLASNDEIAQSAPRRSSQKPRQSPLVSDLRKIWYIQIRHEEPESASKSFIPTPKAAEPLEDIDETYRDKLATVLRPPIRDEPLPSIEFLNLCIHLFFTRFNVALPLIHSPTFRPQDSDPLLVLSICSAGCLSLGSQTAARAGAMLFERVNKSILAAPWERALMRADDHTWDIVKASMIGQTYALTSEDPAHRATAAAYHGSLIALARHHKILNPARAFKSPEDIGGEELEKAWRSWAKQESLRRVAILLYIHDSEIAALFHHEPIFRHNAGYIPTVCSHELFSAPTAEIWASLFRAEWQETEFDTDPCDPEASGPSSDGRFMDRSQRRPASLRGLSDHSMFNIYNNLSGIAACICECRYLDLLSPMMVNKFESDLLTWYSSTPKAFKAPREQLKQSGFPFNLLPFWHYSFITLSTDLNLLELAVGREGTEVASSTREYVLSWIASPESRRCLLHALFLQKLMVTTHLGALLAFNTPRILFSAALCWYCYMLYLPESQSATALSTPSLLDGILEPSAFFPEIQLLRDGKSTKSANFYPVPHMLNETLATLPKILVANPAEMKAETLCVIECILRRVGTVGISIRFANIVQAFISGANDKVGVDENMYWGGRGQVAA